QRLALPTPRYAHLPLLVDAQGHKLSKTDQAPALDPGHPLPALRAAWQALGQPQAALASSYDVDGLLRAAHDAFDPLRIPRGPVPIAATHNAP
ncbi:hypothetical protein SB719_19700, partial [Pantoea sp. SIMBA_079]